MACLQCGQPARFSCNLNPEDLFCGQECYTQEVAERLAKGMDYLEGRDAYVAGHCLHGLCSDRAEEYLDLGQALVGRAFWKKKKKKEKKKEEDEDDGEKKKKKKKGLLSKGKEKLKGYKDWFNRMRGKEVDAQLLYEHWIK